MGPVRPAHVPETSSPVALLPSNTLVLLSTTATPNELHDASGTNTHSLFATRLAQPPDRRRGRAGGATAGAGGSPARPTGGNYSRTGRDLPDSAGPDYPFGIGDTFNQDSGGIDAHETWMDSGGSYRVDVYMTYTGQSQVADWGDYNTLDAGGFKFKTAVQVLPADVLIVHSVPMVPNNDAYSYKRCPSPLPNPTLFADVANGDHDDHYTEYFREMAGLMTANNRNTNDLVIRLGWEMNGDWYPWSICSSSQVAPFRAAWNKIVTIARSEIPNVIIDFSPARRTRSGEVLADWAPDSAYWDVISRSTHDSWINGSNTVVDPGSWEEFHLNPSNPTDVGLQDISDLAEAENRWMALTEWATQFRDCTGITHRTAQDQELFITYSAAWLETNKDRIAWAAWFAPSCTALRNNASSYPSATEKFRDCFLDGSC
ncbi:MAG: hypothetical protein JRI55_16180 [Deltaproteobacteria bacterium]|nr:hypothetical protein [Deltaproteobacteria bacterium]